MAELDHEAGQELQEKNNVINLSEKWMHRLEVNQYGAFKKNRKNIQIILDHDEKLQKIARLNLFSGHNEIYHAPPWRKKDDDEFLWTDTDDAELRIYIDVNYGISNNSAIDDCMRSVFYKHAYHPVKEYLKELSWDGAKRAETLFIDYLGAEDNEYTRTVTRKMLVAAVARIFEPGVKFDTSLILIGSQGSGKSYILSRLGGEWFNESLNSFKGDEALMKLRNSWIIELAELSALKASEVEEVKGFISATVDTYRPKYGRNIARFPRQCVFFGSTNNFEFLKDTTGNRRFWPMQINAAKRSRNPFEELTDEVIQQIWAEAYRLYKEGETLHITDKKVNEEAAKLQSEHTSDDGLNGVIENYLKDKIVVCAREIWHECLENEKQPKRHDITDINQILRNMDGWESFRSDFGKYGSQRGFRRIN